MIVDLHVRADGRDQTALDALFADAASKGLDGLVITPVGRAADPKAVKAAAQRAGIAGFVGVELQTDRGRILAIPPGERDGYVNAPWAEQQEPDGEPLDYEGLTDTLCDLGYALVAPQPFDEAVGSGIGEHIHQLAGIHGVVVAGGRNHLAHDRALELALAQGVAALGGSASEEPGERLGRWTTLFSTPPASQAQLAQLLRRGEACIAVWGAPGGGGGVERDAGRGEGGRRRPRRPPRERRPN